MSLWTEDQSLRPKGWENLCWKRILITLQKIKYSLKIASIPDGFVEKVCLYCRNTLLHQEYVVRCRENNRVKVLFTWVLLKNLGSAVKTRHAGLLFRQCLVEDSENTAGYFLESKWRVFSPDNSALDRTLHKCPHRGYFYLSLRRLNRIRHNHLLIRHRGQLRVHQMIS